MSFDPDKPHNDLPLLPPTAELETKAVLRKAIAANKALAELKGAGELIPNQGVLINAIVLQEAKVSSEIVGSGTGKDEVGLAWPMFAERTYCENMSKKSGFLDISQEHVQDMDMLFEGYGISLWHAIEIATDKAVFVARFRLSRHIKWATALGNQHKFFSAEKSREGVLGSLRVSLENGVKESKMPK